jgi:signal transduction histidine kinase
VIAGLAIGAFNEHAFQVRRVQFLAAQAEVLAATVEPALVFNDSTAAQEAAAALRADRQVAAVGVYDSGGARMAVVSRGEVPPPRLTVMGRDDLAGRSVARPVLHEGRRIGFVYLSAAPEAPYLFVQRHAGVALLLIAATLLVAVAQAAQAAQAGAARESRDRAVELEALNAELRQEISRRETAEEALRQAQKMETLGQLTGGIAHDFNNLLQSVQGALDIISRNPADQRRVDKWARLGLEAAQRGARVTSQLLAFSRAQKLEMRPVDINEVLGRLRELLPNVLGSAVSIRFEPGPGGALAVADATQLELAVMNLCINSRDAMPDGGEIVVATKTVDLTDDFELAPGRYLLLSVADTGVGMPEEVRARAFEPFFTTKGVGKGTGLGLAQVYGIAKQAGGVARVESSAGRGTTVTIFLPAGGTNEPGASVPKRPTEAARGVGGRVLIVDDDEGVRAFVCDVLTGLGYACVQAADGPAGLDLLRRESFDLLIVDYAMPGMTGAQVAAIALAEQPTLPIIFASGYAESAALDEAMGRPTELLRKPFDSRTLAEHVANALVAARA